MTENMISWNVTNWITVVLMVALGYMVMVGTAKMFHAVRAANA